MRGVIVPSTSETPRNEVVDIPVELSGTEMQADLEYFLKGLVTDVPRALMATTHATTIKASTRAYSTAVGPSSPRKNLVGRNRGLLTIPVLVRAKQMSKHTPQNSSTSSLRYTPIILKRGQAAPTNAAPMNRISRRNPV